MPKLPVNNTLDYNPDGIVNASKKITNISLENMKNPLRDPDQATLSTVEAQRRVGDSFSNLEDLAGVFHSLILRIQNLIATQLRGRGRKGGKRTNTEEVRATLQEIANRPRRRVDDDYSFATPSTASASTGTWSNGSTPSNFSSSAGSTISVSEFNRRLNEDRSRYSSYVADDSRNSFATPSSRGSTEVNEDDDDELSTLTDLNDYNNSALKLGKKMVKEERNWTSMVFYLIQITRKMDILVSSRIKPVANNLSSSQIQKLNEIFLMVNSSYDHLVRPFSRRIINPKTKQLTGEEYKDPYSKVIRNPNPNVFQELGFGDIDKGLIAENQYGDEILNTFNSERKKLLLNLTVVINSWKQNSPTGQQTEFGEDIQKDFDSVTKKNKDLLIETEGERLDDDSAVIRPPTTDISGAGRRRRGRPPKKTGTMTMIGCGNNFYGEKINNTRDVPCLLSSIRNCPTKYLL